MNFLLKKEMTSQQQLNELEDTIAAIQQEINVTKEERKVAKERLEKAIEEGKPTGPFEKLLEAATAELTRLGQKEAKLLEEKNTLLSKLPIFNPAVSNGKCLNDSESSNFVESLDFSVASYDSCRSRSKSGICATGRHVNRLKNPMKKMRKALLRRDKCCVATGEQDH